MIKNQGVVKKMGKCLICGISTPGDYKYCIKCNKEIGKANAITRMADSLEKLNWNIGLITEIWKKKNPEMAKEIEDDWKKKKEAGQGDPGEA